MAFTPLPDTARVVMTFAKDTREQINQFHVTKVGGWDATSLGLLCIAFKDWWNNFYRLNATSGHALTEVVATDISVENGIQHTLTVSPPILGANVVAPAPQNASCTMSWRTGFSGRRNRGRTFSVGLSDLDTGDLDTLTGTRVNGLAIAGSQLISAILAAGWELVVASLTYGQTRPILSVVVENIIDSMRRRLPGRGR